VRAPEQVEREPEERVAADRSDAANGDVGPGRVRLDLVVCQGDDDLPADLTEERQRVVLEVELGTEPAPERRLRKGDGEPPGDPQRACASEPAKVIGERDRARRIASPSRHPCGTRRTSETSPTQPTTGVGGIEWPSLSL